MERLKLGVIGCGIMGTTHAMYADQSPRIDVVAVADIDEKKAQTLADQVKTAKPYASAEALINDDAVDAVVLALPACARTELALQAFAKGKHVLTEKPVAMNAAEVEQLIAARGDLVCACCSSRYQFIPSTKIAADFVGSGALGPLREIHLRHFIPARPKPEKLPPAWRLSKAINAGGILVNWGCYDLDYLLGIAGWSVTPERVLAQTWRIAPQLASYVPPESDGETHFAALVQCRDGCVLNIERAEYAFLKDDPAWQIIGEKGSLRLHMLITKGKKIMHDYVTEEDGVVSETLYEGDDNYDMVNAGPVTDFADAILDGREPKTTLEKSLVIQKLTDAIYASAEQGRCVEIT